MCIRRGDIYYVNRSTDYQTVGSEQWPGRPAIVVSSDQINASSDVLEVVYLTTQPKEELATHAHIRSAKKPSVALCEQVTSVSYERLGDYVGRCTDLEMQMVDTAIAISLCVGYDTAAESTVDSLDKKNEREEIIRLQTERDMYKTMYEQMLNRLLPKN